MSDKSKIEWTDATWNPVRGCTKVSPGCKNCYAETFAERWRGIPGHPYEQGFDLRLVPHKLEEPLHWKKPQMIFVNSMSDLFQDGVPFEYIDKVFAVMALTPQHTYQVLTKRADRMAEYFKEAGLRQELIGIEAEAISGLDRFIRGTDETTGCGDDILPRWPLPMRNVRLGVSTENQEYANKRIPEAIVPLLDAGWKTMISVEPMLGPISFRIVPGFNRVNTPLHRLWVIVGGESGPGARPCNVEWVRSIVEQCKIAGVKCFVKQLGSLPVRDEKLHTAFHVPLKSRKGGDMNEWPEDLRVREFPS